MRHSAAVIAFVAGVIATASAQTTQAILRGRVTDSLTGLAVGGASVRLTNGSRTTALADSAGYYSLPLLSPDTYALEASADAYQPRQIHGIRLAVAALVEVDIVLRRLSDVWEQGEHKGLLPVGKRGLATMFGPDIDRGRTALVRFPAIAQAGQDAAVSSVISTDFLLHLPLAGRDSFSLLVMMPGVSADAGTARGVGVAVNGQRPSASNFLLDGVEHNNYVISAPLAAVAPEAISEYRLSSNNFSAEFGRTSGVLANAITRSGSVNGWHGLAYAYLQNEILNANGFQQNRRGQSRAPLRQVQPGGSISGAVDRATFLSGSIERLRTRTRLDPVEIVMPTTYALQYFNRPTAGRALLAKYERLLPASGNEFVLPILMEPPSSLDRWLGTARVDRNLDGGRIRTFLRIASSSVRRAEFLWSPYPDFVAPLTERAVSPMLSVAHNPQPNWTGEYRLAFSRHRLAWERPHPEIPAFVPADGALLPGSLTFYSYGNTASHVEVNTSQTLISPRHAWKWGAGLLLRRTSSALTAGRDGRYLFFGTSDFLLDWPDRLEAMVPRSGASLDAPDYNRRYRQHQWHAFVQDAWRLTPQVLVSLGGRYESFGAPARVYAPDRNNFAVRAAVSWRPRPAGGTVVKGAYGIFYDRPFDNLWQNELSNSIQLAGAPIGQPDFPILDPVRDVFRRLAPSVRMTAFPESLLIAPRLRDAYVHSAFAGVNHRLSENAEVEITGMGALGRSLITTDKINREEEVMAYRANQGTSNYLGGSVTYRHRTATLSTQASYTWSHSIDLQSEALTGAFFDLSFTRDVSQVSRFGVSAFSREGDPRGDRGSSDFDQRHNATLFALWQPRLFGGWRVGTMAALRSGFPYTVFAIPADEGEVLYNLRASYVPSAEPPRTPADGGVRWLRDEEFRNPRPGQQGDTGRNAFGGPGFFNIDASLERSFRPWRRMPDSHRLLFRIESYNLLNHSNLGTPDNRVGSDSFGVALRGRLGRSSSFPAVAPFVEAGRSLQLLLRYQF